MFSMQKVVQSFTRSVLLKTGRNIHSPNSDDDSNEEKDIQHNASTSLEPPSVKFSIDDGTQDVFHRVGSSLSDVVHK